MSEHAPLIEVRDLVVERRGFRLEVPTWTVPAGAVVGVVGPNGAGKTTLLEVLAGLRQPRSGSVRAMGADPVTQEELVRARVGLMRDESVLFEHRIDRLLRLLSGYYPSWDDALVRELVRRFDIDVGKRPSKLSKGQGTRLRLLLAMAFQPGVLLLDEPATGLDLSGRRALLQEVLDVVRRGDRSVIVSSHRLEDLERIADRFLVIHEGRVVREGPADELVGDERTLEEALIAWGAA